MLVMPISVTFFIYLFNKHLSSASYRPVKVLNTGESVGNKTEQGAVREAGKEL